VRQVHAFEHQVNGRERLYLNSTGLQLGLDLGQRDAGLGLHQGAEQILMRLEHWTTMAADPIRPDRAGLAQAAHELDGSRGTDLIADSSLADGTPPLNSPYNAPAQVLGQRCGHGEPLCSRP
jgi:hypothetical protein